MAYAEREPVRGTGWLVFSSIVLITAGIMRVFDAVWAFDKDDELTQELQTLFYNDSLTAYGWMWLIVGVLMIVAGFGVLSGSELARWFGIAMAAVAVITGFLWIYAFPVWSLVSVIVGLLVIYGLGAYGGAGGAAAPPRQP
jgi:hypothetical protein